MSQPIEKEVIKVGIRREAQRSAPPLDQRLSTLREIRKRFLSEEPSGFNPTIQRTKSQLQQLINDEGVADEDLKDLARQVLTLTRMLEIFVPEAITAFTILWADIGERGDS